MTSPGPRLELRHIDKVFPGVKALQDVSFALLPGEVHSLVGENGAGKSTLINVMIGLYQPDGGEIYLDGEKIIIETPQMALKKGIAIVPQEINLIPELTVAENIFLGVRKMKKSVVPIIDWAAMFKDAKLALDELGINIDVKQTVSKMSVANQQLVQIARAMAFGAEILIFDEPTACLTLKEGNRLLEMIENLRNLGKSIVFVSHHLNEVERISDRATIMRDGKLVEVLPRSEFSIQRIIKGMVGRKVTYENLVRDVPEDNEVVIDVRKLTREREFRDISFTVRKGEIFGIAGLVGAGRTELVSTIFGDRKADSGEIYLNGEKVDVRHPRDAIRKRIGYLPEERRAQGILPILPVRENVSIANIGDYYRFPKIDGARERATARDYIDRLHIKCSSMEQHVGQLSGGNQQKVVLSRWLSVNSRILILDEPTRGIDVLAKQEIHELIRRCADEGLTTLVVSSEMEELISLCNRILVMHEGVQKGIVDTKEIASETILSIALN
ncbi:MAG: sugar ABC transporter ATP-binding protein [Clostridiales bacterium]|nr:sugar ABC transporter ATP-binding protein [Clostridiales bacterium]